MFMSGDLGERCVKKNLHRLYINKISPSLIVKGDVLPLGLHIDQKDLTPCEGLG